ncbi:lipase [Methylophaga frappieri]|uniref:Lipase n=1 Tax=Methylophaga frappieri (strain ATCC BAA-2434 / DSM 25690 / JAM7) TaxID=754477 RepID=I1YLL8_METFJ|nr:arylesterase [Methylophaga frappieri]AFJ03811.1 lipase [Methylophaga frappieri]
MKNHIKTMAFTVVLICFITGCDKVHPLVPLDSDDVILAFGDSLTFGSGASLSESYPARLDSLLDQKVINAGVPGEISGEGRSRLPALIEDIQPALVILCHGGNDLLRKLSKQQAKRNLIAMIEMIQQSGADVVLIAVPEPGMLLSPPDLYAELAETYDLNIETTVLSDVLANRALKSDPIHPNAQGYQMIADAISDILVDAGAVSLIDN